jgi:cytochrome c
MICHAVDHGAQNKIGPELNGLDDHHSGCVANFTYSDANKISSNIANPQAIIPGTKMPFSGRKEPQQINDLWAHIKQLSADRRIKN